MNESFIVVIILCLLIFAFTLGWNISVNRWRNGRERILKTLNHLETQVEEFNQKRLRDPQRGWTDVGTEYAISRMQATIRVLQSEIEDRNDREPK